MNGRLELFQSNIFEFDLHPFVVDLQTDSAVFQSSAPGVVGELRSKFAVYKEPEMIPAGDDSNVVPLMRANIR